MLAAAALIFSYIEAVIPFSVGMPGIKLGFANIVIVYVLYRFDGRYAFAVNVVRIVLAGLLFGSPFSALYALAGGMVSLCAEYGDRRLLTVSVHDDGCGIEDVPAAMQPFYSTGDGTERSGMGFCVMQTFMDAVEVESAVGKGTTVTMRKYITGEVGLHRERMLDEIG